MPLGALREQRATAMKQQLGMSDKKPDRLPWSTGMFECWTDPELLYMSAHGMLGFCCIICLPAKTRVDFLNNEDVWTNIPDPRRATAKDVDIHGTFGVRFSSPSYAYAWNAAVLAAFPCMRVWWRWSFREKYIVQGSLIGDIISSFLCYPCTALQEQREIRVARDPLFVAVKKIDGASLPVTYKATYASEVPAQVVMAVRNLESRTTTPDYLGT